MSGAPHLTHVQDKNSSTHTLATPCPIVSTLLNLAPKLEGFYAWAKTENRIAGLNSWHFGHRRHPQNSAIHDMELGAVEMPSVLAKLCEIGEHIVAQSVSTW